MKAAYLILFAWLASLSSPALAQTRGGVPQFAVEASWPKPLNIAINLSPVQFQHGDLATLVHTVLLETGLKPSRLELEITEGVLIGDFTRVVSILRHLKALGRQVAHST